MALVIGWSTTLRGPLVRSGVSDSTIVVVGDSVPFRLMASLDNVAREHDLVIDNASRGGCPPLAIELQEYGKPDHEGEGDCTIVAGIQQEKIEQLRPGLVFWWSRYEIHQRWIDGRIVGPDEEAFWEAQRRDLAVTVDRLTAEGARLVIAQTERPGMGMLTRCKPEDCHPLLDLMTHHDEYRRRWNQIIVDLAASDPRVRTFRMDPILCTDPEPAAATPGAAALCDDRGASGPVRYDGSHILMDPYGDDTAEEILQAALTAGLS